MAYQNGGGAVPSRESALLDASRRGDAVAFGTLVRESAPALERFALRLVGNAREAEEVAQDAVVRAWRKLPEFRGESRFLTWVCRILVRRALDLLRSRRRARPEEIADDARAVGRDPAMQAASRETEEAIRRAIDLLAPVQRATLLLRADQGLSYEEIAYVLGSNRNAVRMNLIAARRNLAERLRGVVDLGEGA